jgi:hypothetical protein
MGARIQELGVKTGGQKTTLTSQKGAKLGWGTRLQCFVPGTSEESDVAD